jgi:branched-chain amino acid aminotransferase
MDKDRLIWFKGNIIPVSEAKINVLAPTSQFGANVFEGIRCYWNEDDKQLYGFKLDDHYSRLANSIKTFRMESKFAKDDFLNSLIDVVKANNYKEDIAVRQTVFIDGLGSWMSSGPVDMFVAPIKKARNNLADFESLRCCISSWERISDRNLSPRIKAGANYINSRMAQMEALQNGYDSAILLNNQGKISEGPGSCIFIFRKNILITPPLSASVLESITRDTVIEIARDIMKIKVEVRDIERSELYISDEAFLCGSAMEIAPIKEVDGLAIGDGEIGKLTKHIHEEYLKIVSGMNKDYKKWLTPIY